ncbi:flavin reductase family protein [Euzebya tangerina]|uniref:flavin reductase family protein n=1 Tax=Euzebya tangerina TaxID=591198 RepID=UPI00196A4967|nr:flavin reductase family protein [Euzebya tangerina]
MSDEFRQVLGQYPTGVTIVTGVPDSDGEAPAMVIGSFGSVSLDPPLVMFLPGKGSSTWPDIEAGGHFGVSVLGAGHDAVADDLFTKTGEHYTNHAWTTTASGAPVLTEALAWLDCTISDVHEAGDHWIVVGAVDALGMSAEGPVKPLVFWQGKYL